MIENTFNTAQSQDQSHFAGHNVPKTKRVMTMVKNERMGGYVPKWETVLIEETQKQNEPATAKERVEQQLSEAVQGVDGDERSPARPPSEYASAYAPMEINGAHNAIESDSPHEPFGFGDLVDMANPLHHIPIVGALYRKITGDEIKSIGHVVGGALFGGPVGMASGLVNAVVADSTGKSMEEHAKAFVFGPTEDVVSAQPETQLAEVIKKEESVSANTPKPVEIEELPGTVISLADLTKPESLPTPKPDKDGEYQSPYKDLIENYPFKPTGSITNLFTTPDPYLMQAAAALKEEKS